MIELSLGKLVLLALIALIVLGPEKLPGAARTAGALLRRVRKGWDDVRSEVERELEVEEIRRTAREAVAQAEAAQRELKEELQQVHKPLADLANEVSSSGQPTAEQVTGTTDPAEPEEAHQQGELLLGEPAPRETASSTRNATHDDA